MSAVWPDALEDTFIDLCVKEVENNNRPNTTFNKEGWENLDKGFFIETNMKYTKKQLRNKWDALKEKWKLWKDLLGKETGLGWDYALKTVSASEEWWSGKIKENKEYGKLRKKGISPTQRDKLDILFKGTSATGVNAYIPGASSSIAESPLHVDVDDDQEDVDDDSDDIVQTPKRRKKNEPGKGKEISSKQGKVGGAALLGQKLDRMCDVIESRRKSAGAIDDTSIGEVMKVVRSLPECEQGTRLFFFATRLFLQKEKREMFCSMQGDDMKLEYLKYEHEN